MTAGEPKATNRLRWEGLPLPLRAEIVERSGSPVREARASSTGFSAGFAGVLDLLDGRRIFVKAGDGATNAETAALHRREARNGRWLPTGLAPRPLWSFEWETWVVLGMEAIDGRHPGSPWSEEDLSRVLQAQAELSRVLAPPEAEPVGSVVADMLNGWRSMRATGDFSGVPHWLLPHVDEFAGWEGSRTEEAAAGESLVHFDLRNDNLLVDRLGRVHLLDWPHAGAGAPWLDLAFFAPTVSLDIGPRAGEVFARSPLAHVVPRDDLRVIVSGWAGRLIWASRQPHPPGIPTLRAFQAAQARTTLDWLRELLDGSGVSA